ncbi:MAG: heat-inducible transcriptional repressor HrcA [Deltaproteobacteria bacterium]|nr:heat-inducible transcriptional repressor HrcA [Deltaproteobacteria bacterium]
MEDIDIITNERCKDVLLAIIEGYLATANPVGSKFVSENYYLNLSPASIRNIMAILEEGGYIYQPHFSAGRVPTAKGYKFYVESLMKTEKISKKQRETIKKTFHLENRNMGDILHQTSRALSDLSHYTGIVLAPETSQTNLLHIEFVRVKPNNILVIMVFKNAIVENRLIYVYKDIKQNELNGYSDRLNEIIEKRDCGIDELRNIIESEMCDDKENLYSILNGTILNFTNNPDRNLANSLYIGPETVLLDEPEFSNNKQIKFFIKTINDKKIIIKLLGLAKNCETKRIFIGSDAEWSEITGLSLITAPYLSEDKALRGSIGIIGPSRMNYSQVIPIIDFIAEFLGEII